jgi:hypothetical protein
LTDVRRTDARSAQIDRPAGVTRSFQVSLYKVEPSEAVAACNLLAKYRDRLALINEVEPCWPQMPLVNKPNSFACRAERLAGARACPNWAIVMPPSAAQGVAPNPDAGEEMTLSVSAQVARSNILDTPFVHVSRRDVSGFD